MSKENDTKRRDEGDRLLKINEAAEMLGLAVGTLYARACRGLVPTVRLSKRCLRFRKSDLDDWIKSLSKPAQPRDL